MPEHAVDAADLALQRRFEAATLPPSEFSHKAHVLLAYTYLASGSVEAAVERIRGGLRSYLRAQGIDPTKYHETLTRAWILAVWHFMRCGGDTASGGDFISRNPALLDSRIMVTHYTPGRLFSDQARECFVDPDLDPIPSNDRGARGL